MYSFRMSSYSHIKQPRIAIRKNDLKKSPINLKAWFIGIFSTLGVSGLATIFLWVSLYIVTLRREHVKLQEEIVELKETGETNNQIVKWLNKAVGKTTITSYVPYLGGINGGGKNYANGEPVLPIAASRAALKNGSLVMGDYVLLVGQIKDLKSATVEGHSFDVQSPDLKTATLIG